MHSNAFHQRRVTKLLLVMKMTTFLLLCFFVQVSARTMGQVTLKEKSATLESVLAKVKKQQKDYGITYDVELVKSKGRRVSVDVNNVPLERALEEIFRNQDQLSYVLIGKVITVKEKSEKKLEQITEGINPQLENLPPPTKDISGKVTDAEGNPLAGASIKVKGGTLGTQTNAEGIFILKGVDEKAVIEIGFVGYETMTLSVGARSSFVVSLKVKESTLQEVVVNKGYYTEKQKYSVGNVTTITAKDIEKQPVQNPLLALQGRVPGLEITQTTGINGGAVTVRIQGINSLGTLNGLAGTEPLVVVDGVPFPSRFTPNIADVTRGGNPLNYINMSDIESISVLKDADATAIYGSRAANGAILITTKKGKAGKPKLSFDVQQGWGKVTRHVDMMNTRQYLDMRYEALKNDGITTIPTNNHDLRVWDTTRYTDWQKELIGGTAQYTNINAGVSGGTDLVQYLIGANYNRQTTVFPGDFANKAGGLHFSLNGASPNQKLRIQLSGSYNYNDNSLPFVDLTQSAVLFAPNAPKLYNEDGSLNWAPNASGSSTWANPLARTFNNEYTNVAKNFLGNLNLSYTLLPGLILSSNFGYNNLQSDVFSGFKLGAIAPENRATAERNARFAKRSAGSWIIEPQLQFGKNIGKGKIDALIGSTIQKSTGNYLEVYATGQPTDELLHSLSAATSIISGQGANNNLDYTTRFNGLFGRIGYNCDGRYLVNLTGRRDGSSKFGAENKFHNFWSAGAGWIFSEEKFLQGSKSWLSFGKLRASYGTTGNDQIADYSYLSLYNVMTTDIRYQGATSFDVAGLSNPFLQWEETRKLQAGIDLSLFNERIAVAATYARNRSSNQLINYSLPALTGFTSFTKNFPATVQNTSWEFSLNTVNVKSKNFNWSTNFNLTIPRNKVISFPGIELTSYRAGSNGVIIGEPIGIVKTMRYGGVDPATGYYNSLDVNGNPISYPNFGNPSKDYTAKVSLLPKCYGGLSNTISYKGFQLDFLFQFVYGMGTKDMYYTNPNTIPGTFASGMGNQPVTVLDRWQKPGDNATIGRYNSNFSFIMWPTQSDAAYSYAAGSYIRLKNASLSWQLPDVWSKRAHLQTARLYFRGQNLATITGYKGLDPETRSISTLPPLQMWTVGAKIEL